MPERRPHFRFEMDKESTISNKRTLAHLASMRVVESLTFTSRSLSFLERAISWLTLLDRAELKVLDMKILEDTEEALEEQALRAQLLGALETARTALAGLKQRKSQIAVQMEEDFDPFFKGTVLDKKKEPPKKKVTTEESMLEPAATGATPSATVPVPAPVQPLTPAGTWQPGTAPPPPVVKPLDPKLVALYKARRSQQKEDAEKELSGPSIGTDH